MEKLELKNLLNSVKSKDYVVPQSVSPYELSMIMIENIGDTDSELRDDLILSVLSKWIIEGVLSSNETNKLFRILLDRDYILNGIGNVNDSIFGRSFSVEILACIIYKHRQDNFIEKSDLDKAFNIILKFYNEDMDVRGYIEGKGWAHGAAHGADALDEFARCKEIGYEGLIKILKAIFNKINVNHYGYIHFEDERMITVVIAILERKIIPIEEIEDWIKQFKNINKTGLYPGDLVIEFNVNSFLKSLFFRLDEKQEYEQVTNVIREVLKQIRKF